MKLRVTLEYEYETDPANYATSSRPIEMARMDVEDDPAIILWANKWTIKAAKLLPVTERTA